MSEHAQCEGLPSAKGLPSGSDSRPTTAYSAQIIHQRAEDMSDCIQQVFLFKLDKFEFDSDEVDVSKNLVANMIQQG